MKDELDKTKTKLRAATLIRCIFFIVLCFSIFGLLSKSDISGKTFCAIFGSLALIVCIFLSIEIRKMKKIINALSPNSMETIENAKPSKRAMPFAWTALVSSILMAIWTCCWASSFFNLPKYRLELDTSYGEYSAWTLILGTFGSLMLGTLALSFGLLGKGLKAENDQKKRRVLLVTACIAILPIILLITAWIFTVIHTR